MTDAEENIKSSDAEEWETPTNHFATAGASSLQSMLASTVSDRLSSKKQSKELAHVKGSNGTQHQRALWQTDLRPFAETPFVSIS